MASVSGSCSHSQKGRNFGVSHLVLVSAGHQEVSHVVCAVYRAVAFNGFPSQSSIRKENSSLFTLWDEIMWEGKTPPLLSPHRLWTGNYLEKSLNLLEGIHGSPLSSWKKCACSCQCWAVWQHATKSAFSCFRGMWSKEESRVSVGELLMGWETDCCSFLHHSGDHHKKCCYFLLSPEALHCYCTFTQNCHSPDVPPWVIPQVCVCLCKKVWYTTFISSLVIKEQMQLSSSLKQVLLCFSTLSNIRPEVEVLEI